MEDKAVRNFRKIIDSKKSRGTGEEKTSVFSYAATVCLALAVLVAGVNLLSESAGKNRGSGRLSRGFRFGGADDTCSNRTGAECIDFAKGGADAETGARTQNTGADHKNRIQTQEAVRETPVPTETTQKREKISITPEPRSSKKQSVSEATQKKDNKTEEKNQQKRLQWLQKILEKLM